MKNAIYVLLILTFITTLDLYAQEGNDTTPVKEIIEKMFDLASEKNYEKISSLILYKGDILEKKNKTSLNPKNANDLKSAERISKKIKAYLDISDSYNITQVKEETKDDLKRINVLVSFVSNSQELKINFKFITLNGNILLEDID